jgi:hypothetical protein
MMIGTLCRIFLFDNALSGARFGSLQAMFSGRVAPPDINDRLNFLYLCAAYWARSHRPPPSTARHSHSTWSRRHHRSPCLLRCRVCVPLTSFLAPHRLSLSCLQVPKD